MTDNGNSSRDFVSLARSIVSRTTDKSKGLEWLGVEIKALPEASRRPLCEALFEEAIRIDGALVAEQASDASGAIRCYEKASCPGLGAVLSKVSGNGRH